MRRALLLLAVLLLALAPAARAQGDSIVIRSYDVDLVVHRDGHLDVTERIRFHFFGPWNGILRDLSLRHETGQGRRQRLRVKLEGIADPAGAPYRHEEESAEGGIKRWRIYVPGARDAERTLVIRYRVENALRFFFPDQPEGALDELYWNVTGNQWTMPIERASARVILPDGVRPTRVAAYTGYEGATSAEAKVDTAFGLVTFATERRLEPGEGLTVAAGWPPGAVATRPSAASLQRARTLRMWPMGLPLLAFFLMFRTWRRKGRDPRALPVVVGYEPPAGLSPAELGTLVDHRVDMHDVTATLVDLAVRGHIGIEEREERKLLGLIKDTEYVFHRRTEREEWDALKEHERKFLVALFERGHQGGMPGWSELKEVFEEARAARAAGREYDPREAMAARAEAAGAHRQTEWVEMSDLEDRFYRDIPGIRNAIYDALLEKGFYRARPDHATTLWIVLAVFTLGIGLLGAVFAADSPPTWVDALPLAVGMGASALIVFSFGLAMPARTEAGARTREAALGFREFLEKVESDRYRRMITGPEMFERYLPYAMAFSVEARWAKAFDDLYTEPPQWYSGSGSGYRGFSASGFTSRLDSMASRAGSTLSSSPSSSGSGGGGSSGGGSGGGGGSGF